MTRSAIRHILTAVGTVLTLFGLDNFVDIFDFANQNLDSIWAAVETLVGFALAIYGFTKNPERHEVEES
ncbi:MAG TPA: hypothetical protein DCW83_06345 [Saprospirales bacterium]|jgi:phage-related protein|nr:hypothetical protein [Saprospirales bacterium]|tara:strand:+ start:3514 stop:3720 length:207 start_codon:yes stop_codon:yes gene_type:complete